ncbi:MBL fold metallo-hydrolase [Paenibacillus xylaniclasticus]|uniref:MBL fold metallo-hydrolase n=1 Tax=Paenibacillus xylaniclasticus TaxID=588083 RepID=UPI000FDA23AE|nr:MULTISPECIES: MBL fold metallo-hydrolase [Paenibacillus]GFN32059.1 MBL fold hydrolase [Paenibacillus curdlanolyticus]
MSATITMIGTGNAFAQNYFNNNAVIDSDDFRLLVDCGITGPAALHEHRIPFGSLDAILISHTHKDHVGGLPELVTHMLLNYRRKPVLYLPETLHGPVWEHILKSKLALKTPPHSLDDLFDVRLMPIGRPTFIAPKLVVEPIRTEHIAGRDSYSFIINERFFYSADMRFNPALIHSLVNDRGIQLIYHDCQLIPPGAVHACLDELLTLPESIQAITKLMHYEDTMPNYIGRTGRMKFVKQGAAYPI